MILAGMLGGLIGRGEFFSEINEPRRLKNCNYFRRELKIMNSAIALHKKEQRAQSIKIANNDPVPSDLCEAIDQGLRDISRGDYVEIRRSHISEDVDKLFESFKED
jgi:hypothetical protein